MKFWRSAPALVLVLTLVSGPSRAADDPHTETSSYTGRNCVGSTDFDQKAFVLVGNAVKATSPVTVVCPVPKTTSGPGITLDAIKQISMTVSGSVSCILSLASNYITGSSNIWYTDMQSASGGHVTFGEPPFQNYWRINRSANDWLYAQIYCSIPTNGQLVSYNVIEHGYTQLAAGKGYAILPPSYCRPDGANKQGWFFHDGFDFLEALSRVSNGKFAFDCPVPSRAGNYIQMTVGPPINTPTTGNRMGCNINTDASTTDSTWRSYGSPEYPVRELTPIQSGSQLLCQMTNLDGQGDAKIVSYRTAYNLADLWFLNGN
jgi:hypothetical protein